jgi:hypothetical protein
MKIALNNFDEEYPEEEDFVKHKNKRTKLTGRQSVRRLVAASVSESDPYRQGSRRLLHVQYPLA